MLRDRESMEAPERGVAAGERSKEREQDQARSLLPVLFEQNIVV